jgi:ferric-dicitrate binding protein FerR (iron transport regulator)
MARVAYTLRIDEKERTALENLSRIEGQPVNKLLNEAIKNYLHQKGQKESAMAERLARLEEYRKQDPEYRRAFDAFIEAEATLEDPLEGEPFEEPDAKASEPVQTRVREILGA